VRARPLQGCAYDKGRRGSDGHRGSLAQGRSVWQGRPPCGTALRKVALPARTDTPGVHLLLCKRIVRPPALPGVIVGRLEITQRALLAPEACACGVNIAPSAPYVLQVRHGARVRPLHLSPEGAEGTFSNLGLFCLYWFFFVKEQNKCCFDLIWRAASTWSREKIW